MNPERRAYLFDIVERTTEIPMLVLSLAVVPLLLTPEFLQISASTAQTFTALEWAIWVAFATELVVKTYLSANRSRYLTTHWFDVVIVILPFARPLRIFRSARILQAARASRLVSLLFRILHGIREVLDQNGMRYVFAVALTVLVGSALLIEHLENTPESNITNFPDALWWATVTITTVGYGDRFPVTPEGRALAVLLMIAGITMFSVLTANLAAFFNRSDNAGEDANSELVREIQLLRAQVEELSAKLDESRDPILR